MTRSFACLVLTLSVLGACNTLSEPSPAPTLLITGVTVRPLDRADANGVTSFLYTDTLRTQLAFEVITHARRVDGGSTKSMSRQGDAGDEFPGFIANPTLPSLSWLSFDRPIVHRGSEIAAHTNLLAVEQIAQSFDGTRSDLLFPELSPFVIKQIHFDRAAFDLTPSKYTAAFRWQTAEGETFADTVQVYIDLQ